MNLDAEVRSLKEVPMFRDVEPAKLKLMAFASDRVTFETGEIVFRQGDPSDSAYLILEGNADVRLAQASGGDFAVASVGKCALVGEMGVLTGSTRSATIQATSPLVALRIRSDVFFDLLREFSGMAIAIMRDLAIRLERTNAKLAETMSKR